MPFNNELDDRQLEAIELLSKGETVSNTAKIVGVNRKTIAAWKKQDKFMAELDKCVALLKKIGRDKIIQNVEQSIENIIDLANNSSDPRVKLQANKYLVDQGIGTPSSPSKDVDNDIDGTKKIDPNTLKTELEEIKNLKVVR